MTFHMQKKVGKWKRYFQRKIDVPGIQKTAKNFITKDNRLISATLWLSNIS